MKSLVNIEVHLEDNSSNNSLHVSFIDIPVITAYNYCNDLANLCRGLTLNPFNITDIVDIYGDKKDTRSLKRVHAHSLQGEISYHIDIFCPSLELEFTDNYHTLIRQYVLIEMLEKS